jgi:hypothetical protein
MVPATNALPDASTATLPGTGIGVVQRGAPEATKRVAAVTPGRPTSRSDCPATVTRELESIATEDPPMPSPENTYLGSPSES